MGGVLAGAGPWTGERNGGRTRAQSQGGGPHHRTNRRSGKRAGRYHNRRGRQRRGREHTKKDEEVVQLGIAYAVILDEFVNAPMLLILFAYLCIAKIVFNEEHLMGTITLSD